MSHFQRAARPDMSTVQIVRFSTDDASVSTAAAHIRHIFADLANSRPEGMRYLAVQSGNEFHLLLDLDDAASNPLFGVESALRFRDNLSTWTSGDRAPVEFTVLGSYNTSFSAEVAPE